MKKVLIIIGIVLLVLSVGAYFGFQYLVSQLVGDQLELQNDTPATPHKLSVDTSSFDAVLTDSEYDELSTWLVGATVTEIQAAIAKGDLSVESLVAFYGKRIGKLDASFNSVIRLNPDILEQARAQDEALAKGEALSPLTGVIVLAKDNISVEGMNTSAGSFALKDLSTDRHAFLVQTMVDKGALIIGKANLSEFSNFMSMPSASGFSTLGGQTKNAYGNFDVGGSSSGSSVASALSLSTVTLGSETAGSLIFPAGQNSVVAIKPTTGLLSRDLIIPIAEAQDTAGVIGRSVEDVFMVYKASMVKDMNDPYNDAFAALPQGAMEAELETDYLSGKRLGFVDNGSVEMKAMRADLERLGATIVDVTVTPASNPDMMNVLLYGIKNDLNAYLANDAVKSPLKDLAEIVAFNKESEDRAPFGQYYLETGLTNKDSKEEHEAIVVNNQSVTSKAIDDCLMENNLDGLVSMSNDMSGIYAPARYPAVTVPSGYKATGEPFGITFVGTFSDDINLLKLAYSYEQGTKYRVNPVK